MLISNAAKAYEADKKIEGVSTNTLNSYRIQAKLLIDHLGNIKMGNITTQLLKNYLAESSNVKTIESISPY